MIDDDYRLLLADLRRQLDANERDIRKGVERLVELMAERQTLKDGIDGIEKELSADEPV
jgi:hypothetical protein